YNEGSIRDWQRHTSQFLSGKTFAGTGAFGPWMVTSDEIGDPSKLTLETRLNGQVVQHTTTDLLITDIPRLIAYISTILPLLLAQPAAAPRRRHCLRHARRRRHEAQSAALDEAGRCRRGRDFRDWPAAQSRGCGGIAWRSTRSATSVSSPRGSRTGPVLRQDC